MLLIAHIRCMQSVMLCSKGRQESCMLSSTLCVIITDPNLLLLLDVSSGHTLVGSNKIVF